MQLNVKEYLTLLLTFLWQEVFNTTHQNLTIMIQNKFQLIICNLRQYTFECYS